MMKLSSATILRWRFLPRETTELSSQNRRTCEGIGARAYRCLSSAIRRSFSARQKPRFGMNGNGWAGSMASGVITGKIWLRKISSAFTRSSPSMSLASSSFSPSSHSSVRTWRQIFCCSPISSAAEALMRASCSPGVRPSWLITRTPSRT